MDLASFAGLTASGISPSLCKPSFCPDGSGRFICGSEEQAEERRTSNVVVLGQLDDSNRLLEDAGTPRVASYPVIEHLRDFQWMDVDRVVFALNDKIGLLAIASDNSIKESSMHLYIIFQLNCCSGVSGISSRYDSRNCCITVP